MKPKKSSHKHLEKLQGKKKQGPSPLKKLAPGKITGSLSPHPKKVSQKARPSSRKLSQRDMNKILHEKNTDEVSENITKKVFQKGIKFDEHRMTKYEEGILREINDYRNFNKLPKLKPTDTSKVEMEQIVLYSVERFKFDFGMMKTLMKSFKKNDMICYLSIYIPVLDKRYEDPTKLETFVMNKWKSQSSLDGNLKNKDAKTANVVMMKNEKGICLFVLLFK